MITKPLGILDPEGKYPNPLNGRPFSNTYKKIAKDVWTNLVCYKRRNEFFKLLKDNQAIILISGTGTGKTVIYPKLLSHFFDYKHPIILTIPTRAAIPPAAIFTALNMDVELGAEVAWAYGGDSVWHSPEKTKILYSTDGYISALIQGDPLLSNYSGILIDEVHTRGEGVDILLANVVQIALSRPEFRIVLMSATIDPAEFVDFFKRSGLTYDLLELPAESRNPVENIFNNKPLKINEVQGELMVDKIDDILMNNSEGNIIAFVTTDNTGEVNKKSLHSRFKKNPHKYPNIPLVGMIGGKTKDIERAIMLGQTKMETLPPGPYGKYTRRVIFATEAVEFSVTIKDDCKFVVDSGIKWGVRYNFNLNCMTMDAVFVAQSSIGQRCGRTGRESAGTCIRMYTEQQFNDFERFAAPKILLADISDKILGFLNLERTNDYKKCSTFLSNMITPVPAINQSVMFKKLIEHNLVNIKGKLTPLGIMVNNLKEPSSASFEHKKMIISSYYFGCMGTVLKLVCILMTVKKYDDLIIQDKNVSLKFQEKTPLVAKSINKFSHPSGDFLTLLRIYDATLHYIDDKKKRKEFCSSYFIDYEKIEKIDELYFTLRDPSEDSIMDLIPFISILNLFDVTNSPNIAKKLEYFRLDEYRDPLKYIMMKGSGRKSSGKRTKKLKRTRYSQGKTKKQNQSKQKKKTPQNQRIDIINDKKIKSIKVLDKMFKKQDNLPEFKYKELPKYRHPYSEHNNKKNDKQKQPLNKFNKDKKPFNKDKKPFNKDKKPFNKDKKPFNKDKKPFNKFNKRNSYVEDALKKIKTYKQPDKPSPDFVKNYKKMKEKEREEKMKLLKPEKNFRQTSSKKDKPKSKPKQEGKPKKPKRKQNLDLAKLIDAELSKVTLKGQPMGIPIKLSQNHEENLLACIFYSYNTNIAAMVNNTDCIYQAKNTPYLEINLRNLETCSLNNFKDKKPELILYDSLTKIGTMPVQASFVNKISNRILNKFGLSYTPPKWEK